MRDVKRIKRILNQIEQLWVNSPDQRMGQLFINLGLIKDDFETWSLEDDDVEKHLEKIKSQWIKKVK